MNPVLPLALDALTLFLAVAYATSATAAMLPSRVVPATIRAREAFRLAMAPVVAGSAAVTIAFLPSVRAALTGAPDHCLTGQGHPHLCFLHGAVGPWTSHDTAATVLLILLGVAIATKLSGWARDLHRLSRLVGEPLVFPPGLFGWDCQVVSAEKPWCFVAGVRRPRLVVSSAVVAELPPEDLAVIAAHEAAHILRRDHLARLGVRLAALVHLPGLGRHAVRRWDEAAERACDEVAATRLGSRLVVAEALVRYQRVINRSGSVVVPGASFDGAATLDHRVRALLAPPVQTVDRLAAWPWVALILLACNADFVHASAESLLAVLHG